MKLLQTPLNVPSFEKYCSLNKKEPAEGLFLDLRILGRLMISTHLFVEKMLSLFVVLHCLEVPHLIEKSLVSTWSINTRYY